MEKYNPKLNLPQLKNIGPAKFLKSGWDSEVYEFNGKFVAKRYELLRLRFGEKIAKKILIAYYTETLEAQRMLEQNPNPKNQKINIGGVEYDFEYKVVPQGAVLLETDPNSSTISEKTPVLAGQKFKAGLNFDDLNNSQAYNEALKQITAEQKIFLYSKEYNQDINRNCIELFEFLNKKLETNFDYADVNIKPYLNTKTKKVEIFITDLSASLVKFYEHDIQNNKLRYSENSESSDKQQ